MATKEEKQGILIDPLEWASKNRDKLKTVKIGNTKVTPQMMIRDRRKDAITEVRDEQEKNILINLSYRDYILFHKICYSTNLTPTQFIEKFCALYDVNNSLLIELLESIKVNPKEKSSRNKVVLTEDEFYDMIERSKKGEQ